MIRPLHLLFRLALCKWSGRVLSPTDFGEEYTRVAATYDDWLTLMARHSDRIVPSESPVPGAKVLDLACGTGYLSGRLLERFDADFSLLGIDVSTGMLEQCRCRISDPRAQFQCLEALTFLTETPEKFDLMFCGWALAYLPRKAFFQLASSRLAAGGALRIIANGHGSAYGVEPAIRRVLARQPDQLEKSVSFAGKLPRSAAQLMRWGRAAGLQVLEAGEGIETVPCRSAEEYLEWQIKTGALAGLDRIFADFSRLRPALVEELKVYAAADGLFYSRHPFVYAVFRKA